MNLYYSFLLGLWHLREMLNLYFSKIMLSLYSSLRYSAVCCFVEPCGELPVQSGNPLNPRERASESLLKVVYFFEEAES
jgi:hypothetical protein